MISSRFVALAGGDEVRLDADPSAGLDFQLLGADGSPIGPAVSVAALQPAIDTVTSLDASNIAALSGGGFVVAYEERHAVVGAHFGAETLTAAVYDADGHLRTTLELPAGAVTSGASVGGLGAFALSGDAFALVYDHPDGASDTLHVAYGSAGRGLTDLALPGPVFHVSDADGALTLGFGDGRQLILGGDGADTLQAGDKGDTIRAGGGGDLIRGGLGADDINGNAGNDTLAGGAGSETLRGGQGEDVISGGAGDDFISGDRGDDTLTGGAGADIFHASAETGHDVINDFDAAEGDRILLDRGTPFTLVQSGDDVVIELGPNHDVFSADIVLKGVHLADLPPGFILLG